MIASRTLELRRPLCTRLKVYKVRVGHKEINVNSVTLVLHFCSLEAHKVAHARSHRRPRAQRGFPTRWRQSPSCAFVQEKNTRKKANMYKKNKKADSTRRSSQAVRHPSTNRALRRLTSEVRRDPVHSTRYGRQRMGRPRPCSRSAGSQVHLERGAGHCLWGPCVVPPCPWRCP